MDVVIFLMGALVFCYILCVLSLVLKMLQLRRYKKTFNTLFHFLPSGEKNVLFVFEKEKEVVCHVILKSALEVKKLEDRLSETAQNPDLFQQAQQEYLITSKTYQTMIKMAEFFGYNIKILAKENSPKNAAQDSVQLLDDMTDDKIKTKEKQGHESFPEPKVFKLPLFELSSESGKKIIIGARDATEAVYNCQKLFDNAPSGKVKRISDFLLIADECE